MIYRGILLKASRLKMEQPCQASKIFIECVSNQWANSINNFKMSKDGNKVYENVE
jgi:hypothetical protein